MNLQLWYHKVWFFASIFTFSLDVHAYDPAPRWGQATVVIDGILYIHGGKSDPYNSYSYDAAPVINDLIYLSLLESFDTSSIPWELLTNSSGSSAAQGPALSRHSISAFNTTHALLFGGQPGPNSPTVLPDRADSAVLFNCVDKLNPSWMTEPQSWGDEPTRRVNHRSTSTMDGRICLIGGEKADGSHLTFTSNYMFDPLASNFTTLVELNGPPDLVGHTSILLDDGRLLVFGGYCPSQQLEVPMSTLWALDTTQDPWSWTQLNISSTNLPSPRRGFAAALLSNGDILIHGGSNGDLSTTYQDGWMLNTSQNPMLWKGVPALSQLGARRDHFAVATGNLTLFGFGYGTNGPAPVNLQVYDASSGSFVPTFSPPSPSPTQTVPGPSSTPKPTKNQGTMDGSATGTDLSHPTSTTSGNSPTDNLGHNHGLTIALGAGFGALGLLIVVVGLYYMRRHARGSPRHPFMALVEGGHRKGGEEVYSEAPEHEISGAHDFQDHEMTRSGGLFATLSGAVAAVTLSRSQRLPKRRDMLADEDTREFGWYNERRRDGTGGSSWSLRSVLGGKMRTREPSIASSLGKLSRRQKSDAYEDMTPLFDAGDAHNAHVSVVGATRVPYRRQVSYASSRSYVDPFADPIVEKVNFYSDEIHHQNPPSIEVAPLSPLQEVPSNHGSSDQSHHEIASESAERLSSHLTVSSSENKASLSPRVFSSDTSSSSLSYGTPLTPVSGEPTSPKLASSLFAIDTPTHQNMRRSDSWWSRFSRTNLLDRRSSTSSRLPDIRDPHPPPRLFAIEESVHSATPENIFPESGNRHSPNKPSSGDDATGMYHAHNKSLISVKTADTAAIERIAGSADVQMMRSQNYFSTSSEGTTSSSFHGRPVSWAQAISEDGDFVNESENPSSQSPHGSRGSAGTRSLQIDHQDEEEEGSTKSRGWGDKSQPVSVRLVQRPSLFVANPDHRLSHSNDSSS